ncbi:hypothetical protein [Pimelobacter simplex]|uniref:hypothetical protein n=1 Tax=Nocardioides simplex TaxID=2045 RepID=UPI0021504EE4|nr:hypothetical protein [Pimelobacter simplex]UUW87787.1 hypothetical protein M0M43_18805 [Pimelobacter simplex]UUW97292.1 hypothetical protein M0M48_07455 [Pimelobacter simplex]
MTKLLALTGILVLAVKVVSETVAAGGPGWLNLVAIVLAWDAIKIGWLAMAVLLRWISHAARRTVGHRNDRRPAVS